MGENTSRYLGRIMSLRRIKSTRNVMVNYDLGNISFDTDPAKTNCTVTVGCLIDRFLNYIAEMFIY